VTLWPAMAGIDAAMAGYGRYRCSYGPKTKIADAYVIKLGEDLKGELHAPGLSCSCDVSVSI